MAIETLAVLIFDQYQINKEDLAASLNYLMP